MPDKKFDRRRELAARYIETRERERERRWMRILFGNNTRIQIVGGKKEREKGADTV